MTMDASVSTPDQVVLKVSGMTCEGCACTIERVLSRLKEIDELIALYRDRRRTSRDVKRLALGHVEDLKQKGGHGRVEGLILKLKESYIHLTQFNARVERKASTLCSCQHCRADVYANDLGPRWVKFDISTRSDTRIEYPTRVPLE